MEEAYILGYMHKEGAGPPPLPGAAAPLTTRPFNPPASTQNLRVPNPQIKAPTAMGAAKASTAGRAMSTAGRLAGAPLGVAASMVPTALTYGNNQIRPEEMQQPTTYGQGLRNAMNVGIQALPGWSSDFSRGVAGIQDLQNSRDYGSKNKLEYNNRLYNMLHDPNRSAMAERYIDGARAGYSASPPQDPNMGVGPSQLPWNVAGRYMKGIGSNLTSAAKGNAAAAKGHAKLTGKSMASRADKGLNTGIDYASGKLQRLLNPVAASTSESATKAALNTAGKNPWVRGGAMAMIGAPIVGSMINAMSNARQPRPGAYQPPPRPLPTQPRAMRLPG